MKWKEQERLKRAEEFCADLGIAMSDAENRLYEIKPNDGKYFNEDGLKSGYLVPLYFSTVSLVIKNMISVLEIGTGTGLITNLLANLCPTAMIYTIDLPVSDKDYEKLAWRERNEEDMKQFKRNIISRENIRCIEKNSFFLPSMGLPREFDLVFVDGGHQYPVVAWDVMFAYNCLRSDGFVFFHDYGASKREVTTTIDYIKDIIDEEAATIPHSTTVGRIAWLRRLTNG